jgi:hypothetical protein
MFFQVAVLIVVILQMYPSNIDQLLEPGVKLWHIIKWHLSFFAWTNVPRIHNMINQRIQKYNKKQTKLVGLDGHGG